MEPKNKKMKFTDLKDMLKQSGEAYGDKTAYIFTMLWFYWFITHRRRLPAKYVCK